MKKKAFIFIILAGIFWGTSALFVHTLALFGITSLQMTFIRSLVSFALLLGYVLVFDKKLLRTKPSELLIFLGIGITFFGTASCYFSAMQKTSVATAVILMYTAPVFVVIYSALFLGEKFTPLKITAIVTMLIGCALVSGVVGGLKFDLMGLALGFLSGISYAAYNVLAKIAMSRKNSPFTTTLYCFLFSTIIGLFVCNPQGILPCIGKLPQFILPIMVLMGFCTCFMPYILYTDAMKALPAGTATALGIVEPMAATVFSIFLDEIPGVSSVCGIILILGAVFLLSRCEGKEEEYSCQTAATK